MKSLSDMIAFLLVMFLLHGKAETLRALGAYLIAHADKAEQPAQVRMMSTAELRLRMDEILANR